MTLAAAPSWFGTLPGWLTIGALIAGAWVFRRGGGGAALDSLETANRVLEKEVESLKAKVATLTVELAASNARTDVALATKPVLEWATMHEARAAARHDATLAVLDLIAKRLGPDQNGHAAAA